MLASPPGKFYADIERSDQGYRKKISPLLIQVNKKISIKTRLHAYYTPKTPYPLTTA